MRLRFLMGVRRGSSPSSSRRSNAQSTSAASYGIVDQVENGEPAVVADDGLAVEQARARAMAFISSAPRRVY